MQDGFRPLRTSPMDIAQEDDLDQSASGESLPVLRHQPYIC